MCCHLNFIGLDILSFGINSPFYNTHVIRKRKLEPHPSKLQSTLWNPTEENSRDKYNAIINHTTTPPTTLPSQEKPCFSLGLTYYANCHIILQRKGGCYIGSTINVPHHLLFFKSDATLYHTSTGCQTERHCNTVTYLECIKGFPNLQ